MYDLSLDSRFKGIKPLPRKVFLASPTIHGEELHYIYVTEQFVSRINAPVICRGAGEELSFESGEALAAYQFEKHYRVEYIDIEDGKVVVNLKEIPNANVNWVGSEEVFFSDGGGVGNGI